MRRLVWGKALSLVLCGILAVTAPALGGVVTFAAGSDQISSVGVLDIAQDLHGTVYFGTDNGLSYYDGNWHIVHQTYGNASLGLLSDHVLSLAFDRDGTLWLGYPDGLQRLEGVTFVTVRDQQLLKSLDIHLLLNRDREMWVAAGQVGVHRYLDGTWTWFQPSGSGGLGCTYVNSMATDPASDTLFAACREGIWYTNGTGGSETFSRLVNPALLPAPVRGVHGDSFGGIYLFNASEVLHFTPPSQWWLTITSQDLVPGIEISDLAVAPDRTLWIATNNGIYAWKDGQVRQHLDTSSGIVNNGVKKLFLDSSDRLWFVTPENVGYYQIEESPAAGSAVIPITTFELPTTTPGPTVTPGVLLTPGISIEGTPRQTPGGSDPLSGFFEAIGNFFRKLLSR